MYYTKYPREVTPGTDNNKRVHYVYPVPDN